MEEADLQERILRFRKECGLSQHDLASFLGVGQRTVSRWERGVDQPSITIMARLRALLDSQDVSPLSLAYDVVRRALVPLAIIDGGGEVLAASASFDRTALGWQDASRSTLPTVLVIEDDESILRATRAVLKRWNFLSVEAVRGEAAVAMVAKREVSPDIAIIDFLLPGGMDGVDTASYLRQIIPGLPVLLITGEATPERMRKISASGLPLITKPVDVGALRVALETFVPRTA
ncbi:response regulator [Magnetospirillum sp. 15-1]|uniref:response regulator n=1 Tax=Magnetospirillum sp. 15-1 TaxID=1979370 RepID=UPI0014832BF0|nr:response regulator [Magnetospirillum sp. 15-1]